MSGQPAVHEIVLPETKPETEWLRGRPVRKVSPKRRHALLQGAVYQVLRAWARGKGEVGPEWRFRLTPPGEYTRPLVPDVAYVSYERLRGLSGRDLETPPFAPDIVVEILSPDDRAADVQHKREIYLATGAGLLLIVDPDARSIEALEDGAQVTLTSGAYESRRFAGLRIAPAELFAELDIPPAGS